jgi:acetolactate synthase-1/2/3 large subunit
VHLIVPYNVFKDTTNVEPLAIDLDQLKYHESKNSKTTVDRLKNLILSDQKIIFWIGDSLNKVEQSKQIIEMAEKFHIPVATSFSAKGVIPEDHELAIGNFGYAGSSKSKEIFLSDAPDTIIGFDIEQNERNSLNWNLDLYKGKDLLLINYPGSFVT